MNAWIDYVGLFLFQSKQSCYNVNPYNIGKKLSMIYCNFFKKNRVYNDLKLL